MIEILMAIAVGSAFGVGIFQLLRRNLLRSVIGVVLIGNAINLFLLSTGAYDGVVAAYSEALGQRSDALPQALILTAIVISMGGIALILSLLYVISTRYSTSNMDDLDQMKH
jgi:multicomponent Na+:H+ antiporter subunit C